MDIAVILSTYNSPAALRNSLLGYVAQKDSNFQLLVADDGSDDQTKALLEDPCFSSLNLKHVWHEDDGYRVSAIRNLAIAQADADYLIFSDGDVIPRQDFVANHRRESRPATFTAGGRINLPESVYKHFTDDQILTNQIFKSSYLKELNFSPPLFRRWSLKSGRLLTGLMNLLQWRYCVFYGSNTGVWREDVLKVNGFDQDFGGYGGEDRDIGFRLRNLGIKFRYLKHSFVQYHMDHPRPYYSADNSAFKRSTLKSRMRSGITWIPAGIRQLNPDSL